MWAATARFHGLPVSGHDRYSAGAGAMRWRLLGVVPAVTAAGGDVTRSAPGRLAAESPFFPTTFDLAALGEGPTADVARCTWHVDGNDDTVELQVARDGALQAVMMQRWKDGGRRVPFGVQMHAERRLAGVTIPVRFTGWWDAPVTVTSSAARSPRPRSANRGGGLTMTVLDRARSARATRSRLARNTVKALLGCGIAYPVVYVVTNDVIAARRYNGYSRIDQAVSELSATGAPTRRFLVELLPVYTGLTVAYGIGVWNAAAGRRALRRTGAVLLASGATGVAWLPFPMSSREVIAAGEGTSSDIGHLALSGLTIAEIFTLFAAGSTAFGRGFRRYSQASAAVALVAGALTGVQSAKLQQGKPTPRLGLYERTSMGAWMTWMAALAAILLREQRFDRGVR